MMHTSSHTSLRPGRHQNAAKGKQKAEKSARELIASLSILDVDILCNLTVSLSVEEGGQELVT